MGDRRAQKKAAEVYADHAYTGGYDLDGVYGKKKPFQASQGGVSACSSLVEDSWAGPYSGGQYASPYVKPAAKPPTADDDYSGSRPPPPAAASGYGKQESYEGDSRPSEYVEEEEKGKHSSSRPGYGRRPDHGGGREDEAPEGRFGGSDHGRKPGYGAGEYETEDQFPAGGGSGYGGWRPAAVPSGEYETGGQFPVGGGGGYGGRRPAVATYEESEEVPSRPSYRPQSQYEGRNHNSDYSEGRIPEPRKPAGLQQQQQGSGDAIGYGDGRRPHGSRPGSEYEAPRPAFLSQQEAGEHGSSPFKYGNPSEAQEYRGSGRGRHDTGDVTRGNRSRPFKHGNLNEEQEYGAPGRRYDDGERLASETAGLSLGSDRRAGRKEGYRPERDESDESDDDSDDEKKRRNKHHEKHGYQKKHHDDDY